MRYDSNDKRERVYERPLVLSPITTEYYNDVMHKQIHKIRKIFHNVGYLDCRCKDVLKTCLS